MMLPMLLLHLLVMAAVRSVASTAVGGTDDLAASSELPADGNDATALLSTFDSDPEFRHQQPREPQLRFDDELTPTPHYIDYLWPPSSSDANVFDDTPVKRAAQNFIRLGRTRNNAFMRLGRGDKGFIRFGRSGGGGGDGDASPSNGNSIGRRDNGFLRFGRANGGENPIQYGGFSDLTDDSMRFGRRGDKFIRFGRSQGAARLDGGIYGNDNSMDRENSKRYEDIVGGKSARAQNFIRLGRARTDNNFIRLGRKADSSNGIEWGSTSATGSKNAHLHLDDNAPPTAADIDEPPSRLANDNDFPGAK